MLYCKFKLAQMKKLECIYTITITTSLNSLVLSLSRNIDKSPPFFLFKENVNCALGEVFFNLR